MKIRNTLVLLFALVLATGCQDQNQSRSGGSAENLLPTIEIPETATEIGSVTLSEEMRKCRIEGIPVYQIEFCGRIGKHALVLYQSIGMKAGMGALMESENEKEVRGATLKSVGVVETRQGPAHGMLVTLELNEAQSFLLTSAGMPNLFGVFMQVMDSHSSYELPEGAVAGYHGTVAKSEIMVYSLPKEKGEPENEIEAAMEILYPEVNDLGILLGGQEISATDQYSFGGGAHIFVELEGDIIFLFSGRGVHPPFVGRKVHQYFPPLE